MSSSTINRNKSNGKLYESKLFGSDSPFLPTYPGARGAIRSGLGSIYDALSIGSLPYLTNSPVPGHTNTRAARTPAPGGAWASRGEYTASLRHEEGGWRRESASWKRQRVSAAPRVEIEASRNRVWMPSAHAVGPARPPPLALEAYSSGDPCTWLRPPHQASSTITRITSRCSCISSTRRSWARKRSRLCPSRWMRKYTSPSR
jgi:hypothetical protein